MMILTTQKEVARYVNEHFASESVNRILFGFEEMENADARRPHVLYRMVVVAYMAIYAKWLHYGRKCFAYATGKHARNVFDLLQITYKTQPFNLDVVIYILSESKRDAMENGEASFFYEFFSKDVDCRYSTLYELLREALDSGTSQPSLVIEKMGVVVQDLKVLHGLEFLQVQGSNGIATVLKMGEAEYNPYDLIIYQDEDMKILQDRVIIDNNIERHYRSLENFNDSIKIEKLDFNRKKGI